MNKIYKLTLKSAMRDPFLLLWSLIIPVVGTVALGHFVKVDNYPQIIAVGMVAASIIFYAFMTTSFQILGQRRRGVYNLLHVTPLSLSSYILSTSAAWMTITIVCGYIVLFVGYFVFKFTYSPLGLILMLPIMILGSLGYIFFSFFISSLCNNENQLSMVSNLITMPIIFCSNAFYSLEKAPAFIKVLTKINPFEYFVNGLAGALNLHWKDFGISLAVLGGCFILTLLLSVKTFRYSDR